MGRRHEEKVDEEELARLENPEDGSSGKIRVKMPNRRINEMFALADQILVVEGSQYCARTAKPDWPESPVKCVAVNGLERVI